MKRVLLILMCFFSFFGNSFAKEKNFYESLKEYRTLLSTHEYMNKEEIVYSVKVYVDQKKESIEDEKKRELFLKSAQAYLSHIESMKDGTTIYKFEKKLHKSISRKGSNYFAATKNIAVDGPIEHLISVAFSIPLDIITLPFVAIGEARHASNKKKARELLSFVVNY